MIQFLSRLLYVIKGKRKSLVVMLLLFLLISSLEVIGTGMIGPFIALATNPDALHQNAWMSSVYQKLNFSSDSQLLVTLGGLLVAIFYIKSFLSFYSQKAVFEFGFNMQGDLSFKLMCAYMAAPYTFHLSRNSAELIQNILNITGIFANGLLMPLLTTISNALVICALILLLINTNLMAVVIIGGILVISFGIFYFSKDKLKHWGEEVGNSQTETVRFINHGLGGIKETRVIGCESYFTNQLRTQTKRFGKNASLAVSFSNLPRYLIEAFLITFLIGFTFLFITLNRDNPQSLSAVLGVFALASIRLLPAAGNLTSSISGIRYNLYSVDKLYLDLKELEEIQKMGEDSQLKSRSSHRLGKINGQVSSFTDQIVLDQITYCYPNVQKNALEQVSIEIKKGQSIGLIGKSGAGKTTLVDVILGLLVPQSGDITVDGISIYGDLRAWQNMIGYVPQSIFLIDDTFERNIAFGVPDHLIDPDRLDKALEAAQLTEVVAHLPDGIKTMVGERGVLLSGGQRQRVGIARALYHEREILVFDEATAALDNETEGLVTEAIESLSGIKTMIIIAHRLSTIERCDRIYMLEKGRLVKSGKYHEVVPGNKKRLEDPINACLKIQQTTHYSFTLWKGKD